MNKLNKLKLIIIFETILIIILIILLYLTPSIIQPEQLEKKLLSSKIYTGLLPSENYLILNFKPLEKDIQEYINNQKLNISVFVLNMRDGASFGIDEDYSFEPASLNKLPIAMIILKKIEEGKLSLDTILQIQDKDRDPLSGTLYNESINELSVRDLLYYMLAKSDNAAFKVLGKYVSIEDLQYLSTYINYYNNDINYTINHPPNIYKITPKATGNLFLSLYFSTILKPEHSEMILSYLTNTTFNIKEYAKLPSDIIVAQKHGSYFYENKNYFHSCGILYIKDSRIFYCIMSRDLYREEAYKTVGEIVNKIYNYVVEAKKIKSLNI